MQKLARRKSKLVFETGETVRSYGTAPREKVDGRFVGKPRRTVIHREIVVEAHERQIVIRLKGTQKRFTYTWGGLYAAAARLEAEAVRKAKAEVKKSKRGVK